MQLIWTDDASRDHDDIIAYIADRNPAAAERMVALFDRHAQQLKDFPEMHRPGRAPGTREAVVHPNYLLIYRVEPGIVRILAVLHARQQYP
ncbi:type II toxin-antitoxin system RelE/ParE family toxin [Blastomonas sp.]|uniref:type II toxin-antitoxin system RelE/ParE family toxin n=1 Tax=Blastomonas sp. TaxID=1909299 RepID=UPI003594699A